jgi:putative alpha-1,2-mannosidase
VKAKDPKNHPGRSFTVIAHNVSKQNTYIKSARLNGQNLETLIQKVFPDESGA